MPVTKISAIQALLSRDPTPLSRLYRPEIETQVLVGSHGGERIDSSYQGPGRGYSYTDNDGNTWKSFRIPYRAYDEPEFNLDSEIHFDLSRYADGIGLTGWDWQARQSLWVGFDFDSLVGHSAGLSQEDLEVVREKAQSIPWVEVRRSTSGRGFHFYVYFENPVPTANHTEHAALARTVLGQMNALAGFDFSGSVDCFGVVLWIWHRIRAERAFSLVKEATERFVRLPADWKAHVPVIERRRSRARRNDVAKNVRHVDLDETHQRLITWLDAHDWGWEWDQDGRYLRTHTAALEAAHADLEFAGRFETVAEGKDKYDINCFAFPNAAGSWRVYRYGHGTQETRFWTTTKDGAWTWCHYNRPPSFNDVVSWHPGTRVKSGAVHFETAEQLLEVMKDFGLDLDLPDFARHRESKIQNVGIGQAQVAIKAFPHDREANFRIPGLVRNRGWYEAVHDIPDHEETVDDGTARIRSVMVEGSHQGYYYRTGGEEWVRMSRTAILDIFASEGTKRNIGEAMIGKETAEPWELVSLPFEPEYPGGRAWNRGAARFATVPEMGQTPHWDSIFAHCGRGLDAAVRDSAWCRGAEIRTGADYLRLWCASMFQRPRRALPYLFFYGPENVGKSILHEALGMFFLDHHGYVMAESALQTDFNGELEGAVLCVVEEIDLSAHRKALNLIKSWVASPRLKIHAKGRQPYTAINTTHWIQTANSRTYCPVFDGDTRITVIPVRHTPQNPLAKEELFQRLRDELPAALYSLLDMRLPGPCGRLGVPVLETNEKLSIQEVNRDPLSEYCDTQLVTMPGNVLDFEDFRQDFLSWLEPNERLMWNIRRLKQSLPDGIIGGVYGPNKRFGLANLCMLDEREKIEPREPVRKVGKELR